LGEWTVENEMKINPGKSKAVRFTEAKVEERVMYYYGDQLIPGISSFKYLGIIICSDINWADHVNYTQGKAWKALQFIMRILKEVKKPKRLTHRALLRPTLEYEESCWDPYRGHVRSGKRFMSGAKESG
jgi:hypothetical protein